MAPTAVDALAAVAPAGVALLAGNVGPPGSVDGTTGALAAVSAGMHAGAALPAEVRSPWRTKAMTRSAQPLTTIATPITR